MKARLLSLLVALAMLTSSAALLVSCGGDSGTPSDTTASTNSADTTTAETTTAETAAPTPYDYIDKKWDGETFTLCSPSSGTRYIPGQFLTEEETGDIIMDGAYRRNLNVSEAFGVDIVHAMPAGNGAAYAEAIRAEVQSSGGAFDLVTGMVTVVSPLAVEGLLFASSDLPYQEDISEKPWYGPNLNTAIQVNGKQYQFFSDMTCITLSCTYGMFYNVTLGEKYGIKDVDELALSGGWTIDKLMEYSENISQDLNSDGTMDKNDQFGLGHYGTVTNAGVDTAMTYFYGFGQRTAVLDKDGNPTLVLNNEKSSSIIEKLVDMCYTGNRTANSVTGGDAGTHFAEGKCLFWNAIIMHAPNYMRDMKDTFVCLPMPKWDENQEEYYTTISYSSSVLDMIPVSVRDVEMSSAIFDALAYEGSQEVIPAYFEFSMKLKFSADNTASQLFDIIRAGAAVDFGMLYDNKVGMYQLPAKLLSSQSTDFASSYAALKDAAEANYKKVMEEFAKLDK